MLFWGANHGKVVDFIKLFVCLIENSMTCEIELKDIKMQIESLKFQIGSLQIKN